MAAPARPRRGMIVAARIGLLVVVVGLVEIAVLVGLIRPTTFPAPHTVISTAFRLLISGDLLAAMATTSWRVLIALVIGTAIGLTVGTALWRRPALAASLEPLISSLYAVPWLLFYPLLLLVFGVNDVPIIFIAAIRVFAPVTLNTLVGLRGLPPVFLHVGRVFNTPRPIFFRTVLVPAIAPSLVAGVELGVVYGFLSIVSTEFLVSTGGLGYAISQAYSLFRTAEMYAFVLAIVVVSFLFSALREQALRKLKGR